eukprot:827441-Amorphochlora_amoeboformis.AAC.3
MNKGLVCDVGFTFNLRKHPNLSSECKFKVEDCRSGIAFTANAKGMDDDSDSLLYLRRDVISALHWEQYFGHSHRGQERKWECCLSTRRAHPPRAKCWIEGLYIQDANAARLKGLSHGEGKDQEPNPQKAQPTRNSAEIYGGSKAVGGIISAHQRKIALQYE